MAPNRECFPSLVYRTGTTPEERSPEDFLILHFMLRFYREQSAECLNPS